jgi:hypothetical protein
VALAGRHFSGAKCCGAAMKIKPGDLCLEVEVTKKEFHRDEDVRRDMPFTTELVRVMHWQLLHGGADMGWGGDLPGVLPLGSPTRRP